jgi:hypothetical protein
VLPLKLCICTSEWLTWIGAVSNLKKSAQAPYETHWTARKWRSKVYQEMSVFESFVLGVLHIRGDILIFNFTSTFYPDKQFITHWALNEGSCEAQFRHDVSLPGVKKKSSRGNVLLFYEWLWFPRETKLHALWHSNWCHFACQTHAKLHANLTR